MKNYIIILSIFSLILNISSCTKNESLDKAENKELKNKLILTVENNIKYKKECTVNIKDLTDFQWDNLYIFTPYTFIDSIHVYLGFKWSHAIFTGINNRDDMNLLVFTNNNKVVSYIEYPRSKGDFYKNYGKNIIIQIVQFLFFDTKIMVSRNGLMFTILKMDKEWGE